MHFSAQGPGKCVDFIFQSYGVQLLSIQGRLPHAVRLQPLSPVSWLVGEAGGERRGRRKREGEGGLGRRGGGGCFAAFPSLPQSHFPGNIKFLLSLPGCPALALGISLVSYTWLIMPWFAVAIATTRGQFIEKKRKFTLGVSFQLLQSMAENKDQDTWGGNTWKSLLRAEASFRASHCTSTFFFAVKAVLEPPIGAWRFYPCVSQIFLLCGVHPLPGPEAVA